VLAKNGEPTTEQSQTKRAKAFGEVKGRAEIFFRDKARSVNAGPNETSGA
jgi:hypothetical protein